MRICSLLPSATEMACALGLEDQLVGVSHECDYPATVQTKPKVVHSAFDPHQHTPAEIDRLVSETLSAGRSLYKLDIPLLKELKPDLILTQSLCEVCAPSGNETVAALSELPFKPPVLYLTPRTSNGIWENLLELGKATGRLAQARQKIQEGQERLAVVWDRTQRLPVIRTVFMEWVSPLFNGGHWVPEMIHMAGGHDPLGSEGKDSHRILWQDVVSARPEVLVVGPCGYTAKEALAQAATLSDLPNWNRLPAVQNNRVFAVDANSYYARPSLRVVEGTEILAHLLHPHFFPYPGPAGSYSKINN